MTEQTQDPGTDIATIVEHHPQLVLLQTEKRDALIAHIEQEVAERTFDLSTSAGRDECRSFAAKITKSKTTLDRTAKELTEEWRTKTAAVNAERKTVVERLDALAKQARQPLTDWENAEEMRVEECTAVIQRLTSLGVVSITASSADVEAAQREVAGTEIDPARFQGMTEPAIKAKNHTTTLLEAALAGIKEREEQAAELARLRADAEARQKEDEERAARETAEREAREAEERKKREAEEAEQRRLDAEREAAAEAERAEAERAERERVAAEQAAETARREAEARAAAEAAERERAQAAALQAERERAEAAERQAEAERKARADEEQKRKDAEAAEAARRAQMEADEAHRTNAKREAKQAFMTVGMSEDHAQKAVLLIIAGEVPRVSLDWSAAGRGSEGKKE